MTGSDQPKSPGNKLTVIIRDDSPIFYSNDSPSYRTVVIRLTAEQERLIMLQSVTPVSTEHDHHESISQLILEEDRS